MRATMKPYLENISNVLCICVVCPQKLPSSILTSTTRQVVGFETDHHIGAGARIMGLDRKCKIFVARQSRWATEYSDGCEC